MNSWRSVAALLAALLVVLVLAACNKRGNSAKQSNPAEAEVVGELLAISDTEVSITDIADSLMAASEVKTLAERINMDHISVRYSVKGMPNTTSDAARALTAARDSFATVLRSATPDSRERIFLEHELAIHSRYLPMLEAMAAKVPDGDLKNIVERLRQVEDLHIGNAQRVLGELSPPAANR